MTTLQEKVMGYISTLYALDPTTSTILSSGATELQIFEDSIEDVLKQFFVDTATWGLTDWENFLGIKTDVSKPIEQRRSVIKSKIRGAGTATPTLIKSVAESYDNGIVSVTEDNANYSVTITFISTRGIPPNLDDIKKALQDVIPAHLAISYAFTYLIWSELDAMNLTWDELDAMGLTWDQFETLKAN